MTPPWTAYLDAFHEQRAGITERVLRGYAAEGDPYRWLAEALPREGAVLDLACGSGALAPELRGRVSLGVDRSLAELRLARARGMRSIACADAARLPLPDGAVEAVACSLALMLVPLAETLAEVRRVLRPGGLLVATVPADGPLGPSDALRYARLLLALRQRRLRYPNDDALADPAGVLARAGLRLLADERRRFTCRIEDGQAATTFFDSLYLPDAPPDRRAAGRRVVQGWAPGSIGVPLRRLVAAADPRGNAPTTLSAASGRSGAGAGSW